MKSEVSDPLEKNLTELVFVKKKKNPGMLILNSPRGNALFQGRRNRECPKVI